MMNHRGIGVEPVPTGGEYASPGLDINLLSLEDGLLVVIKKINLWLTIKEVYHLELDFFSKVSHTRVVPLLGHCLEKEDEKFVVYKHMPNGDLSTSLYRESNLENDALQSLDWITKLKIAIRITEGLSYLITNARLP
ncbi:hypothetical protein V6N11_049905 [Hibiscus sabdariffa]|uniref:Uncharacterized protein n=2 Tax=Hibiscus sabdariffa TaxID=183260 RepID=A0ABR1ZPV2_9ROSI